MESTPTRRHLYPRANPDQQPTPWWYFGRAVYVSRYDYRKIFLVFLAVGIPLGAIGVLLKFPFALYAAFAFAGIGLVMLVYSLIGLYRQYGHSSVQYFDRMLKLADAKGPITTADLHIGTYRHSYRLAELLPEATIYSVDCWNVEGPPPEKAIRDVRDLEPPPAHHSRIHPLRAQEFKVPLPDSSCDLVVFGFGTHEVPVDGPRETLFNEARRILKPGLRTGYAAVWSSSFSLPRRRKTIHEVLGSFVSFRVLLRGSHCFLTRQAKAWTLDNPAILITPRQARRMRVRLSAMFCFASAKIIRLTLVPMLVLWIAGTG
ncbi:MAG: class I SAM-dependent methyltransferase, partial [Pyrinomonadaceae bacterium]